jgi:hypothetical protein
MNSDHLQQIVGDLQTEVGTRVTGNGSLTLHFQDGRVQAIEVNTHTRVRAELPERRPNAGLLQRR